ncbi:argininosuccinate lyase [Bacillota bacterium]
MKLWKGRFSKEANSFAEEFNASIETDQRLYKQDIEGSLAHALMLGRQGIIPMEEAEAIRLSLRGILEDIEAGKVEFTVEQEDIHMNIESLLTERLGASGKRLHTGRSRNDQVATDLRLYQKAEIQQVSEMLTALIDELSKLADVHRETVMPGYTHLQRAQPVTLALHLGAYAEMFKRDLERFLDCYKRTDMMPLGSGALAGTTYPIDRSFTAAELGFSGRCENTMDAVSDRDFAIEFAACCAICMMHLSRFCEELILWSSSEFAFIEMDDAFSTGSSIMPQKKNPDMAELIRGKTGRVYGDLFALLTIMKGLPLAYNKDMQEDKPPLFDAGDTLKDCLTIFTQVISTMEVKKENMEKAVVSGFMNATDAADYLVKKGLPFRDCHEIIGKMVLYCIGENKRLDDLTMDEFKRFSFLFEEDIYANIDVRSRAVR